MAGRAAGELPLLSLANTADDDGEIIGEVWFYPDDLHMLIEELQSIQSWLQEKGIM